jgi:CRP-like cAMP-binding protein
MSREKGSYGEAELLRWLKEVPLFSPLKERQLKSLAHRLKERKYEGGETIAKEGEVSVAFYLIGDGEVEVKKKGKVLAKLGRGQFFGEMTLLDRQPRSADVVTTRPTTCFVMTAWEWDGLLESQPKVMKELLKVLARRLRDTDRALTE